MGYGFKLIAEGPYACFTRPDRKGERISYDVPTPGALEGMLKSIYWKPAIRYVIDQIVVFNAICFQNVRQRMFGQAPSAASPAPGREARSALALRDVRYGIAFHFEMTGVQDNDPNPSKQYSMMLRRFRKGQCFRQPCFGMTDYPVTNLYLVDDFDLEEISPVIRSQGDVDLGEMLYNLVFKDTDKPVTSDWNSPDFAEVTTPVYYTPHMVDGVIDVQKYREA